MQKLTQQSGMSVVEIVIASAILLTLVVAVAGSLQAFLSLSRHTTETTQATLLLEEGAEALLIMRDLDWDGNFGGVTLDTAYWLTWSGSAYALSSSTALIDNFYERQVVFVEVRRDDDGLFDANGDVDTNTLRAEMSVYRASDSKLLGTANSLVHNSYAN